MMKMVVGGSREWQDVERVREIVKRVGEQYGVTELWNGGARGADLLSSVVGRELGWQVVVRKADWDRWGKAAGMKRTEEMLREVGQDVVVVVFVLRRLECRGSWFTVRKARELGLKVMVVEA